MPRHPCGGEMFSETVYYKLKFKTTVYVPNLKPIVFVKKNTSVSDKPDVLRIHCVDSRYCEGDVIYN